MQKGLFWCFLLMAVSVGGVKFEKMYIFCIFLGIFDNLIIFSGQQKTFSILFHEFDMYFAVLLKYFYNISIKPIIINTSTMNS